MDWTARALAAERAARSAGKMLVHHGALRFTEKAENDFVTELDPKSEKIILLSEFPEDAFYGEEGGGAEHAHGRWIVDPIDGTQSFLRGQHGWCISIAYEYEGELVVGCVYAPDVDELFLAVRGKGDPNTEGGEYQSAIPLLYGVAYTIKMSKKGPREIEGYFDFVVPPLEGFWWQERTNGEIDYARKDDFNFISCIRLPDFVTRDDFEWAVAEAAAKKKLDFSAVELLRVDEGLCVQCMHAGLYDSEPATIEVMRAFAAEQGYAPDFSEARLHHEIYLSDPRKCAPEKLKTVVRHPVKPI